MRLFKSNKSQGSLQNISAGKSPLHSPIESPLQSPSFPPPQSAAYGLGGVQHDQRADPQDSQRIYSSDELQPNLAHSQSRVQSQNTASHGYQGRPTVNVIPDNFDENHLLPLTATSATNQEEHRHKKHSKRSFLGLHSSKDNTSSFTSPALTLGRSLSTRKKGQGQESQEGSTSQLTPAQYSGEGYHSDTFEEAGSSTEYIPSQVNNTEPDEHFYRQQNFDSPQSQSSSHYSTHGQEEDQLRNPQQTYYRPQPPRPSSSSNQYLPYNPQSDRPSLDIYDPYATIRPPSQQSLGPPSPITSLQQSGESRPSTVQGRQPNQPGQAAHLQLQAGMARGESNNPSLRQQMAQQHQGSDQGHGQYGMPQGSRQLQQHSSSMTEHGRNTPPPSKSREEFNGQEYATLVQKHEELQAKYSKVKKYYFEKDAQVTALQNTVANQRLSMSKTTLDDHEYTTRFNRLDAAINNLSFNIRKDWKGVPPWLAAMVNQNAHTVGTKEMIAIGRACITRWVVDEILDRYFHPRLEPGLSSQLKIIEKNIRRTGQTQVTNEEQRDDQVVKLTSWRLTTLEGLADSMATEQGNEYKQQFTANLMEKLTASLQMNLNDPPPAGLESGVGMIIELAIGIASSLPLESRDVYVEYYMPGSFINETYMKVESGIPALTNPGVTVDFSTMPDPQQGDQGSTDSGDTNSVGENEGEGIPPRGDSLTSQGGNGGGNQTKKDDHTRKKGFLGGLVGGSSSSSNNKKPSENSNPNPNPNGGLAPSPNTRVGSASSGIPAPAAKERESMEKLDRDRRIRFAAFVGVEVRGKGKEGTNVLVRAPCFGF